MGNRVFVGNLSFATSEEGLSRLFVQASLTPEEVHIITDRMTGRSRGFGFVQLADESAVEAAVRALDGIELDGRPLTVHAAHERPPHAGPPRSAFDDEAMRERAARERRTTDRDERR